MPFFSYIVALAATGATTVFRGVDVLWYYIYIITTFMSEYPWQVRVSYLIVLISILMMLVLMVMFTVQIRRRARHDDEYLHCINTYGETFYDVLSCDHTLSAGQIYEMCDAEPGEFDAFDPAIYVEVLLHVRLQLTDVVYMPNLQQLCELTGAKAVMEQRLKAGRDVTRTLQFINTLPLRINEGLLSVYINHGNRQIRQLARMSYAISSKYEPYRYVLEDMNQPSAPWYRIALHRLIGWKYTQHYPMPPLMMMAQQSKNPTMAAFFIEEVSYWGTEHDKEHLPEFFNDERIECRIAAVRAVARLGDASMEDRIIACYSGQPQSVRREMLRAIRSFHTGKQIDFFVEIFRNTPSHTSYSTALECLYDYNEEGRQRFEQLAQDAAPEQLVLFQQIRAMRQLPQI